MSDIVYSLCSFGKTWLVSVPDVERFPNKVVGMRTSVAQHALERLVRFGRAGVDSTFFGNERLGDSTTALLFSYAHSVLRSLCATLALCFVRWPLYYV